MGPRCEQKMDEELSAVRSKRPHDDDIRDETASTVVCKFAKKIHTYRKILQFGCTSENPEDADDSFKRFTQGMSVPTGYQPSASLKDDHCALKDLLVGCSKDSQLLWDTIYLLELDAE